MKFKNVSPRGDLDLAPAGVIVLAGELVDVDDVLGVLLADQPENWEPADKATKDALAKLAEPAAETETEGDSE